VRERIIIADGEARIIVVHGSRAAKLAGDAWAMQQRYLRGKATEAELARFAGKRVGGFVIDTDPAVLEEQQRTGALLEVIESYKALS
jgi:hypothetical protein